MGLLNKDGDIVGMEGLRSGDAFFPTHQITPLV